MTNNDQNQNDRNKLTIVNLKQAAARTNVIRQHRDGLGKRRSESREVGVEARGERGDGTAFRNPELSPSI